MSNGHRILWEAGREVVDEIVTHDCTVHLEAMDHGVWHLAIYPQGLASGKRVAMTVRGSIFVEEEIEWDEDAEHVAATLAPSTEPKEAP